MWYGICDCNHFYASCERLYRPDLRDKPVVVLSNNDGCIVALTKEAKEAGLRRGDPLFKVKDIVEKNHVFVFSSNYALYQDISDKVMMALREQVDGIQQYSIDESFFTAEEADQMWCDTLQETMVRWTGMPVAVAVARTKTLAKAGEEMCKHSSHPSLFVTKEKEEEILSHTAIGDVWGIGWRGGPKLQRCGVMTALDLIRKDDVWIRKRLGINGLKTAMELRGTTTISVMEPERKSMCSGISFGVPLTTKEELKEAAARHAMTLAGKLHAHHLAAATLTFTAFTDRFREDFICPLGSLHFSHPTAYAPILAEGCGRIIDRIFVPGRYKGCRIWATDLIGEGTMQLDFTDNEDTMKRYKKQDAMGNAIEEIHQRYGRLSIMVGATGLKGKDDLMHQERLSPHYTTRFSDLPVANANPITRLF
jgi:DNA polymerase V